MRSSKIAIVFVFMSIGCAAPLSNLQRAEWAYTTAEAEKKKEEEKVRAAQAQADAARQSETTAREGLATALVTDAQQREQYVQDEMQRAKEARDRACQLNPKMEGCTEQSSPVVPSAEEQRRLLCEFNPQLEACKKDELPPAAAPEQQPVAAPPPVMNPAPATPTPAESFVDYKMNDFSTDGMQRLSSLPVGWEVGFDAAKGNIFLTIDGVRKYERSKPAQFRAGICYRFKESTIEACPAAQPPQATPPPASP